MIFIRVLVTFAVRLCQVKAYHTELAQYSDYRMFQNFTLSPLAQAGIDNRAPFFSRWIRWTPPSFQWHNPVSAWLSLRVRASDYRWCPNIDCFLYIIS